MATAAPTTELKKLKVRKTVITPDNRVFFPGTAHVNDKTAKVISNEERKARKVKPYQEEMPDGGMAPTRTDDSGEGSGGEGDAVT